MPSANGAPSAPIELFFEYIATPVSSGAAFLNASATLFGVTLPIANDADFKLLWLKATSTGSFKLKFYDGSTGRAFMSDFVNNANLFGTAQLPWPILPPYVFKAGGSISFDITDTSAANNTIQLDFSGMKIFASLQSGSAGQTGQL